MSPTDDLFSTGAPGGIRNTGFAAGWIAERVHDARPSPNGQSWVPAQITAGDTVCAANQLFHNQAQDVNAILESHTDRTASLYDVRSPLVWASRISVPVFLVGGLHDECRTFPMAAGVSEPLPHRRVEMRAAINRDDACVVDHLDDDGDIPRRLKNLVVVVVDPRHHRAGDAPRDAAVVQGEVLHLLPRTQAERALVIRPAACHGRWRQQISR